MESIKQKTRFRIHSNVEQPWRFLISEFIPRLFVLPGMLVDFFAGA